MEVGPDYVEPERGHMEPTTWSRVEVGHIVRDQTDRFHTVLEIDHTLVKLKAAEHGVENVLLRPSDDRPVDIYVPSEQEALNLLDRELGARVLRDYEEREHTIAQRWRSPSPVGPKAVDIRDHIDMLHGVKVDDVLRKGAGTKVNPADKKQRAASLQELRDAHAEMHTHPGTWPMAFPHTH